MLTLVCAVACARADIVVTEGRYQGMVIAVAQGTAKPDTEAGFIADLQVRGGGRRG